MELINADHTEEEIVGSLYHFEGSSVQLALTAPYRLCLPSDIYTFVLRI